MAERRRDRARFSLGSYQQGSIVSQLITLRGTFG